MSKLVAYYEDSEDLDSSISGYWIRYGILIRISQKEGLELREKRF